MAEIKIGDRLIGDGHPTYIIAEIGVNHNGILELAIELIDVSLSAGADAVKFQKRKLDNLYPKKYLENANAGEKTLRYLLPILQQVELADEAYYKIVDIGFIHIFDADETAESYVKVLNKHLSRTRHNSDQCNQRLSNQCHPRNQPFRNHPCCLHCRIRMI